jgi:hypothetical protein
MTDWLEDRIKSTLTKVEVPQGDVNTVMKRGRGLRLRRRLTAALLSVTLLFGSGLVTKEVLTVKGTAGGKSDPAGPPSASPSKGRSTTYRDSDDAYTLSYPAGWHRAERQLTRIADPREILALGTFGLPEGGGCAPSSAFRVFDATDALIFLTEYERHGPLSGDRKFKQDFKPRPSQFKGSMADPTLLECFPIPVQSLAFRDNGRFFNVFVAIGRSASEETRQDVWRILDSLRFEEGTEGSGSG